MNVFLSLKDELEAVKDPRVLGRTKHNLIDILALVVIAILCQAETWDDIEDFGNARLEWLKKVLELPNGIPSHDTISRVFSLIEPREFEIAFINWVNRVRKKCGVQDTFCIDGKRIKGTNSANEGKGRDYLAVVNVWSTLQGLVLGQFKSKGGGNSEKSAVLDLLDVINIEGVNIVGDAGIGTSSVANKIIEKKGNYTFPIKKNSRKLFSQTEEAFAQVTEKNGNSKRTESHCVTEKGHGRSEKRLCTIIKRKYLPDNFNTRADGNPCFHKLSTIGRIVYESEEKETRPHIQKSGKYTTTLNKVRKKKEIRYFVSSLNYPAKKMMEELRKQWAIENQLHWVLDVSLNEDGNRTRNKIAAENLAVVRKIALNLVKQDKSSKAGIKRKLKKAAWDLEFLEMLLFKTKLS